MVIKTKVGEHGSLPVRQHETDGGADLYAAKFEGFGELNKAIIQPFGKLIVDTDVSMEIPKGYIGDIRPRSGLFFKKGIICAGTIDSDYRGNIKVCLRNLTNEPVTILFGERIAQICIVPVELCEFCKVDELSDTNRGNNGFGSTGR